MLKQRWFLYATEFFSGITVMAVELGASRLLAPYFSASQIVWTIIIGTIMIAMALGNVLGGRLADRNPNPDRLYLRLTVAALWIAAVPFFGKYVIALISLLLAFTVEGQFLVWASFASCLVLFVFPLLLLGTVTPSLVKYTMQNLENAGKTVGIMEALNTIGSILGTFLPTFVTIPAVGTNATFLIFAGVLLLLSLLYFLSCGRHRVRMAVSGVLAIVFTVAGLRFQSLAFWQKNILAEEESIYNYLRVTETDTTVSLSTNVLFGVQSVYRKDGSGLTGTYSDYALAAPFLAGLHQDDPLQVLILGMATGTYAMQCNRYFEDASVVGVEIDSKIVDLGYRYFGLPEDTEIHIADGRSYLSLQAGTYDVIYVDAYRDITIPFQMSTQEFFREVLAHLTEDGVLVVNLNMLSESEKGIQHYLIDTVASVFPYVCSARTGSNCELYASRNPHMAQNLEDAIPTISDPALASLMSRIRSNLEDQEGGDLILTDDKAPVELLGIQVIDEMIQEELDYYREQLAGKSLKELLEWLS